MSSISLKTLLILVPAVVIAGCPARVERGDSAEQTLTGRQTVEKIFLHWTAGSYQCDGPSSYHAVIEKDGSVKKLVSYNVGLEGHTYRRNRNSASISTCCMGGEPWVSYPCTEAQLQGLVAETARLAASLGWTSRDITVKKVLTHAEAAGLRDMPLDLVKALVHSGNSLGSAASRGLPHDNYGPSAWYDGWPGGVSERWDWAQTKRSDAMGEGGSIIRRLVQEKMGGAKALATPSRATDVAPETDGGHSDESLVSACRRVFSDSELSKLRQDCLLKKVDPWEYEMQSGEP